MTSTVESLVRRGFRPARESHDDRATPSPAGVFVRPRKPRAVRTG